MKGEVSAYSAVLSLCLVSLEGTGYRRRKRSPRRLGICWVRVPEHPPARGRPCLGVVYAFSLDWRLGSETGNAAYQNRAQERIFEPFVPAACSLVGQDHLKGLIVIG